MKNNVLKYVLCVFLGVCVGETEGQNVQIAIHTN